MESSSNEKKNENNIKTLTSNTIKLIESFEPIVKLRKSFCSVERGADFLGRRIGKKYMEKLKKKTFSMTEHIMFCPL
jgi:hypothetical protein